MFPPIATCKTIAIGDDEPSTTYQGACYLMHMIDPRFLRRWLHYNGIDRDYGSKSDCLVGETYPAAKWSHIGLAGYTTVTDIPGSTPSIRSPGRVVRLKSSLTYKPSGYKS